MDYIVAENDVNRPKNEMNFQNKSDCKLKLPKNKTKWRLIF